MLIMNKLYPLLLILLILGNFSYAQQPPKREMRAIWIASVGNIDWPSKKGLTAEQQKQEFLQRLDFVKNLGFNTVIVQVRPAADAFYKSSYEPWSRYLSGTQGQYPGYDPLAFMVTACHQRNMDIHAWFNPYRALVSSTYNPNPDNHPTKTRPHWIINYGGKSYFDPGNPEVKDYIIKVMMEAVRKYDIDAVHIDDYFYPYPYKGQEFPDYATWTKYGKGMERNEWRRANVDSFIKELNMAIKKEKPWVKFGVSPFGIWRNAKDDPEGSATNGSSCYDVLHSDVRKWVRMNWVDYIAPQLYWERGHSAADFDALLPWWNHNKYKRDLVIGLGLYKMAERKSAWRGTDELLAQIKLCRAYKVEGIAMYSLTSFDKIGTAIQDSLIKKEYFGTISIPPANPWITHTTPTAPQVSAFVKGTTVNISWNAVSNAEPIKYLVYRFKKGEQADLNKSENIIQLTQQKNYIDVIANPQDYYYIVTSLDRLWNESEASNKASVN